jgi:putative PIN family toxin of toxin-antitoxin system
MKVILDTNVVLTALRSKNGLSRKWLQAALTGKIDMLVSIPLFLEYEEVLKRPEQLTATGLTVELVNEFLNGLSNVIIPVEISYLWRPQLSDPKDEMVLEAAVNGQADWLITYNVKDFAKAARYFSINVGTPHAAWAFLSGEQK